MNTPIAKNEEKKDEYDLKLLLHPPAWAVAELKGLACDIKGPYYSETGEGWYPALILVMEPRENPPHAWVMPLDAQFVDKLIEALIKVQKSPLRNTPKNG